ncbi:HNH endonuclease [Bradyrhizobium sp.]
MIKISIKGGDVFLDDEDFEIFSGKIWHVASNGYVVHGHTLLHRQILGLRPGDGLDVDHRNGIRSDCTRKNMRICTRSQNQANRGPATCCKSGMKGVTWYRGKWQAKITHMQCDIYLGRFESKELAQEFYQLAAEMLYGEFAYHLRPEQQNGNVRD